MSHIRRFLKNKAGAVAVLIFLALTLWRAILLLPIGSWTQSGVQLIWGASYQAMALWGALCGLVFAGLWGGWKSLVGRANLVFALGLAAQLFGQSVSSFYFYKGLGVPYPSLGDIGFFGSVLLYIYGALLLARATGVKVSLKSFSSKLQAVLIPILILCVSFYFFLNGYQVDWTQPIKVILDFGYPLGQALYVSIAILVFLLSRRVLGGAMRIPMLCFIFALLMQYAADFTFLYQSVNGLYVAGGVDDFLYLLAYFFMSISLIELAVTFKHLKNS